MPANGVVTVNTDRMYKRRVRELEAEANKLLNDKNRRIRNIVACRLHLLDLKRAGHTSSKTELGMGRDYGR